MQRITTTTTDLFGDIHTIVRNATKQTKQEKKPIIEYEAPEPPIDMVKINANSLSIYKQFPKSIFKTPKQNPFIFFNPETQEFSKPERKKNTTNGFISDRAGCRLRNSIKYLFWISHCIILNKGKYELKPEGKLSFLTLTLSYIQQHEDTYIKAKMLNQFIIELSQKYKGLYYIWRAEKQDNGNIHFHFLINKFIPWQLARQIWNRIQDKEGYIEAYRNRFCKMSFEEYLLTLKNPSPAKISQYKRAYQYGKDNNWSNPNSIDITNLKSKKSIYKYISKYISKRSAEPDKAHPEKTDHLAISGRLYYCCSEISSIKAPTTELDGAVLSEIKSLKKIIPDKFHELDFFTIITVPAEDLFTYGCFAIFKIFTESINPIDPTIFNST